MLLTFRTHCVVCAVLSVFLCFLFFVSLCVRVLCTMLHDLNDGMNE